MSKVRAELVSAITVNFAEINFALLSDSLLTLKTGTGENAVDSEGNIDKQEKIGKPFH